jgi:hypothetical protein
MDQKEQCEKAQEICRIHGITMEELHQRSQEALPILRGMAEQFERFLPSITDRPLPTNHEELYSFAFEAWGRGYEAATEEKAKK